MESLKTVWRWWWGWNTEDIEHWLEYMEQNGWSLLMADVGCIRFTFKKGEKKKCRYCADYRTDSNDNYFNLFMDDGWELVWKGALGWYIWRKPYEDERPSIYTDASSLIGRDKRIIAMVCTIMAIQLPFIGNMFHKLPSWGILSGCTVFIILAIGFEAFCLAQLYKHMKKLEEKSFNE